MVHTQRLIQLCLITLLFNSLFISAVQAQHQNTELFLTDATLTSTDSEPLFLHISNVTNLTVLTVNITWNPEQLIIQEIQTNPPYSDFNSVFTNINTTQGILSIDAYQFSKEGLTGNITVLQFNVTSTQSKTNEASITLTLSDSILYNANQEQIQHSTHPGLISLNTSEQQQTLPPFSMYMAVLFILLVLIGGIIYFIIQKKKS